MTSKTFRLFRMLPCFMLGVASVMDLGATINIYNVDVMAAGKADYEALKDDWEEVGRDLYGAVDTYERKTDR